MAFYADTSALIKLVSVELNSKEMRAWADGRTITACDLVRTELGRAAFANGLDPSIFDFLMSALIVTELSSDHFAAAGAIRCRGLLRSLDAIHLVAAISLAAEIEGFVTYDACMARAASEHGLDIVAPGLQNGWYL